MFCTFIVSPSMTFLNSKPKPEVKGTSLPISLVACEARGAVGHTFSPVDDKVSVARQVHLRAQVHGDAAPALKFVSVWRTVWHAAALVVVVQAGGAGHVVVGLGAAAQALAVATLPLVCAGQFTMLRTHWRRQRKMGKRSVFGWMQTVCNVRHCYDKVKEDKGEKHKKLMLIKKKKRL